jgi:peptidoglycan/xylan/chitin deacetylase (PgdA/CDA1 family)
MTSLPPDYLSYPRRAPGLDHDRYAHSKLFERTPVEWPRGARIALWIVPILEWFPLDMAAQPLRPPGGMERPHPDFWNFTLRDYGNRVGAYRIFRALDERELKASVAFSSRLVARAPQLMDAVTGRGWEVMAHGTDMGHVHHGAMEEGEENQLVGEAMDTLRRASSQPVVGWSSPAQSESWLTPDLVAEHGGQYIADWNSDDLPFAMRTRSGRPLAAMPMPHEISDIQIFLNYRQRPAEYTRQVVDYFRYLYREAERFGGRVVTLQLHPWLIGVPFRIGALEEALDRILDHAGVWNATGASILDAWQSQQRNKSA